MNEDNREQLTESQLSSLLKKWVVVAPEDLEDRVMRARKKISESGEQRGWWRFLLKGTIRVPVPVACCLALLMIAMVWRSTKLEVACVALNPKLTAVPLVAARTPPAPAKRPVASCAVNSTC